MKEVYGIRYSVSEMHSAVYETVFTDREVAERVAKGMGWYGGDGTVFPMKVVEDFPTWKADEEAKKRAAALSKLTADEIALLGLK